MNYNLIGKLIRCFFPKHYHTDLNPKQRVLEGEVVATKYFHRCDDNENRWMNSFQVLGCR